MSLTLKIEFDLSSLDDKSKIYQKYGLPHFYIQNFPGVSNKDDLISLDDFVIGSNKEKEIDEKWPTALNEIYSLSYHIDYLSWEYNSTYGIYLKVFVYGE